MPLASTLSPSRGCASTDNVLVSFRSSVLSQKFAILRCVGLSVVLAEAFDGSENVVGGLGPFEWLGICVVTTDEVHNVCAQSLDAAVDSAPDFLVGDESEEALDLIEPGRTGGREMDMPARPFGEPVADQWGVCTDNLNAGVAVMKSAQDGA
jgi:hypothetical protein